MCANFLIVVIIIAISSSIAYMLAPKFIDNFNIAIVTGSIFSITSSITIITGSIFSVTSSLIILARNFYMMEKDKEKLGFNLLMEEIKNELVVSNIQKIIVDFINTLSMINPHNKKIENNKIMIKNSLIDKDYDCVTDCLQTILLEYYNIEQKQIALNKNKQKIDDYEKEIGAETFVKNTINTKEKGWKTLL